MKKQTYLDGKITLYNGDCLEVMQEIKDGEVDLVLTDPPYLYLDHKLDKQFNQELFFELCHKILAKNSNLCFFGRGKSFYYWNTLVDKIGFNFKEEIIWDKNQPSSPTLILQRIHETIALYQKGQKKLNEVYIDYGEYNFEAQKDILEDFKGLVSSIKNCKTIDELNEWKEGKLFRARKNKHKLTSALQFNNDRGFKRFQLVEKGRRMSSIIRITREHYQFIHPTQKPVKLFEQLINLTTQENEFVFDGFSGSGTGAIACIKTKRRFIGCEIDNKYFDLSCKRIEEELRQKYLF